MYQELQLEQKRKKQEENIHMKTKQKYLHESMMRLANGQMISDYKNIFEKQFNSHEIPQPNKIPMKNLSHKEHYQLMKQ